MPQRCFGASQALRSQSSMEFSLSQVIFALLLSFCLSLLITPFFRKLAIRLSIIDSPNQSHKSHVSPVPYLGGASIVTSFLIIGLLAQMIYQDFFTQNLSPLIFLAAPLFLSIVGLVDDITNLSATTRFLAQSLTASVVTFYFFRLDLFGTPTGNHIFDLAVCFFWIVGITNAINLIDNLDGGAAGVCVISSAFLTFSSLLSGQNFLALVSSLITGTTLGFFFWNRNPARIYLGDSGALFLGCIISILIVQLDPVSTPGPSSWLLAFSLMAVPILDTSVVVASRISRGVSPFTGSQDHLSHILLRTGMSRKMSALLIWLLTLYFCVLGLLLNFTSGWVVLGILSALSLSWTSLFVLSVIRSRQIGAIQDR